MPASLHKLLIHAPDVVGSCVLPIGCMSEEAAEARNKNVQQYRLRHTRKDSREHTMEDLFVYLLVSSDPVISSLKLSKRRTLYRSGRKPLLPEVPALIEAETPPSSDQEETDSSCSDF